MSKRRNVLSISQQGIEAAEKEARQVWGLLHLDVEPAVYDIDEIEAALGGDYDLLEKIPSIGADLPSNWVRVKLVDIEPDQRGVIEIDNEGYGAYLVDSSGFGHRYESALTVTEFVERLQPGYGYAIVDRGEYQNVIGVFQSID